MNEEEYVPRDKLRDLATKGPKKRDPACLKLQADILIPRGTVLRQEPGKQGKFTCGVGYGSFTIEGIDAHQHADIYKLVVVA